MIKFEWTVVGAGPAGMLSVGKLLDRGIAPESIAWIDPAFKVGDLGRLWRNVPSNTKVRLFLAFLRGCQAFRFDEAPDFNITDLDPTKTCELSNIADPLQWVSDHLCQRVKTFKNKANHIELRDRAWQIQVNQSQLSSKNVVLAVGAEPKVLPFVGPEMVALCDALDVKRLDSVCQKDDVVAVFGSSHSAILVLRNLIDSGIRRVVNFYQHPLRYAVELEDWILFDDTGLKGTTADWAREHLDGIWPSALERVISSEEHITQYLPECNKVIYAVGFERRNLPIVAGMESLEYNPQSGIIAPGLFGIGLAFPECRINPIGIAEHAVGLWKFLNYVDRIFPFWMKYGT